MRIPIHVIGSLFLVLAVSSAAERGDTSLGQAMKASSGPAFEAHAGEIRSMVKSGDAAGLANLLTKVRSDPTMDSPTRERVLYESLKAAALLRPDDQLRELVDGLANYQSETLIWTDDHGHREYRPLFDIAVTAKYVGRVWIENESGDEAARAIGDGQLTIISNYPALSTDQRRGVMEAFQNAPRAELLPYRSALVDALAQGKPLEDIAAIVARKTTDAELLSRVLVSAPAELALRSLQAIEEPQWSGQRLPLLSVAAKRPETQSAAMLAIGRLAATNPSATEILLAALGTPAGASAAAALAQSAQPNVIYRLNAILQRNPDEQTRRHALLGLRITDSPAARDALSAFARQPSAPAELVAEIPARLRE
jgi:hypothetical protein